MGMRVIAGSARGVILQALPGEGVTRPTVNRVKEAMFSSVQFTLPGARVLDLFGGSGQLGIEALSRGASACLFIEQDRRAARIIAHNCRAAGVQDKARILCAEASAWLSRANDGAQQYDLILLDPPYGKGLLQALLPGLAGLCAPGCNVLCESEPECILPAQCGGLIQKKQYRYGKIMVTRYEKEREHNEY